MDEQKAKEECQALLYATKAVLGTDHEKVTPMSGPDAGKRIKVPIDTVEKTVRILAAFYTLVSIELRTAIEDEARNRVTLSQVSGRKPWES